MWALGRHENIFKLGLVVNGFNGFGEIYISLFLQMQSPDLLSMIQALQTLPELQAVLADPEIMNAVMSGNYAALMNHPKIIALTRNEKMREVIDEAQ